MDSPPSSAIALSFSDVGSSISQRQPQIPIYDQYPYQRRPRRRRNYTTPSTVSSSYYSHTPSAYSYYPQSYSYASPYAPSSTHTVYSGNQYTSQTSEGMYFSLEGKLVRSYKDRSYRKTQKLVLDLYPDLLQGIASSRIEFYVNRIGVSRGRHVYVKSYISKHAWATEIDALAPHETVVIDVRPSLSLTESLTSFFGGKGFA
ncbi:hypothetical protein BC827DRAFT_1245775 [Russula dissimulans]|nr:hypothetical protein BC827DRAFT_1245775 [Russula dissimulans]